LTIGSTDLGRGCKTVLGQLAVKELGISYDQINVLNEAADAPPFCLGSFASRVTLIAGNAVVSAARRARGILFDLAAKELEPSASDLVAAKGKIYVIGPAENL
jgi:CO/xanthine dehydrogenase Mo-binding subunit